MIAKRISLFFISLLAVGSFVFLTSPTVAADATLAAATSPVPPQPVVKVTVRGILRTAVMEWLNSSGKRITTKYGVELDEKTLSVPADRPLVIVVHGYNSCPQRMSEFSRLVREAGYACGAFCYPNDQSIAESAALLSRELSKLAIRFPDRRIAIVTHSMGGLVGRETVENPALDPGNVSQLIMVAPPSHGTSWAYVTYSADFFEYGIRCGNGWLDRIYGCLEDGMGEARYDLQPGSQFLKDLNTRPRNPKVQYSIFLGTGTTFSRENLEHCHQMANKCCESNRFLSIVKPAIDSLLSDVEDAVEVGDGVVSVARGKLDGVDDTTLLGFDHWNVIREPKSEAVTALHREILARLGGGKAATPAEITVSSR